MKVRPTKRQEEVEVPVKLGVGRQPIILMLQEEMEYHGPLPERFTGVEEEVGTEAMHKMPVFWKARLDLEEPEAEDEEEGTSILRRRAVQIREAAEVVRVPPKLTRNSTSVVAAVQASS